MWISDQWNDFCVLDASSGEKLEKWGPYVFIRPDPQVIWSTPKIVSEWSHPDAYYTRSNTGGGHWNGKEIAPFKVSYRDMFFHIQPMNFKHTGLFPEQAVNWDWMRDKIEYANRPISVLNLFAYTGAASVACAKSGASVVHVDASKGMVNWAKENASLSGINQIRFIVDDCAQFVQREIRRGHHYDAIILDPPSYGRGPKGEKWTLEENLYPFLNLCKQVLSENPLFLVLNTYTTGLSSGCMTYLVSDVMKNFQGVVESSEIGLPVRASGGVLPCGATTRWFAK